mmetsp:Transcript_71111/g.189786  ORF Transcript_71111/g.189786 Transcript_71111/m.189786 type:complete len:267 (+) Transcript_71111:722-1522(+)
MSVLLLARLSHGPITAARNQINHHPVSSSLSHFSTSQRSGAGALVVLLDVVVKVATGLAHWPINCKDRVQNLRGTLGLDTPLEVLEQLGVHLFQIRELWFLLQDRLYKSLAETKPDLVLQPQSQAYEAPKGFHSLPRATKVHPRTSAPYFRIRVKDVRSKRGGLEGITHQGLAHVAKELAHRARPHAFLAAESKPNISSLETSFGKRKDLVYGTVDPLRAALSEHSRDRESGPAAGQASQTQSEPRELVGQGEQAPVLDEESHSTI